MSALSPADFDAGLKILYPDGLEVLWYPESVLGAWLPKATNFTGKDWRIRSKISPVRGSTVFTKALVNKANSTRKEFTLTRSKDYVLVSIESETIYASKGDEGAILEAISDETESAMYEYGRSKASLLWGNGGGSRGQLKTGWSTSTTIELQDASEIVRFEENMLVQFANGDGTDTSHALRQGGATRTITAINEAAGTFTVDSAPDADVAATDYIFRDGDFDKGAQRVLQGVRAWIPKAAPGGSDDFFGLNRSVHVSRLAGGRVVGAGANKENVVFKATALNRRQGGRADTLFINSETFGELLQSLQSRTWIDVQTDVPGIGFRALAFPTPNGTVKLIEDRDCPKNEALLTRRDSWLLRGLGKMPHFNQDDGLKWRVEGSDEAVEARLRSWCQLGCKRPQDSTHITWTT